MSRVRRIRGLALATLLAGALGACGPDRPPPPDVGAVVAEADGLAAEGHFGLAADAYARAFALVDPTPANAARRAELARARAEALARSGRAADAAAWRRWADRLGTLVEEAPR